MKIVTKSTKETKEFAGKLAVKILNSKHREGALTLALQGDLGAGKTTFVQGFFKGLGIKTRAVSPTFIIFRKHKIPGGKKFKFVYHMDAYRLKNEAELNPLGFDEIINNPANILLVEWADNIKKAIPKNAGWIILDHGKNQGHRTFVTKNI